MPGVVLGVPSENKGRLEIRIYRTIYIQLSNSLKMNSVSEIDSMLLHIVRRSPPSNNKPDITCA